MSASSEQLIRARHSLAVVAIVDATFIVVTLASFFVCAALGLGSGSSVTAFLYSIPHLIITPWGLLLLCLPALYNSFGLVILTIVMISLDSFSLFTKLNAALACFPSCSACGLWSVFLAGGFWVLSFLWFGMSIKYIGQAAQEERRADMAAAAAAAAAQDEEPTKTAAAYYVDAKTRHRHVTPAAAAAAKTQMTAAF